MPRWKLTLSGSSTDATTHEFSNEDECCITIMISNQKEVWSFVPEPVEEGDLKDSLGQLNFQGGCLRFQPFSKKLMVRPWQALGKVNGLSPVYHLFPSRTNKDVFIFLRPGDVVDFDGYKATMSIAYDVADGQSLPSPVVEVKSSEPYQKYSINGSDDAANAVAEAEASETDDDDDDLVVKERNDLSTSQGPHPQLSSADAGHRTPDEMSMDQVPPNEHAIVDSAPTDDDDDDVEEHHERPDMNADHSDLSPTNSEHRTCDELIGEEIVQQVPTTEHPITDSAPNKAKSPQLPSVMDVGRPRADESQDTAAEPYSTARTAQAVVQETPTMSRHTIKHSQNPSQDSTPQSSIPARKGKKLWPSRPLGNSPTTTQNSNIIASPSEVVSGNGRVNASQPEPRTLTTPNSNSSASSSSKKRKFQASTSSANSPDILDEIRVSSHEGYNGDPPRMLISNTDIEIRQKPMSFLHSMGAKKTDRLDENGSNFLIVGSGPLKTTAKLLMSLVLDKRIVTDEWVTESQKAGYLLKPVKFIPEDLFATRFQHRRDLFKGRDVVFTQAQKKQYKSGYSDMQLILKHAGANNVATKSARDVPDDTKAVLIGLPANDNDALSLLNRGLKVYRKELISSMIVKAELLFKNEEFMLESPGSQDGDGSSASKKRKLDRSGST